MKTTILVGALVALATGLAIGVQSTITSRVGSLIGDVRTGLITNFLGGVLAGTVILFLILRNGPQSWKISGVIVGATALSGLIGILIISGISFSLQRAGIAAGLATVIVGQLVLSMIIDTFGIGGVEAIPFSPQRLLGLLVMGLGVFLLLPRS
ncbi:MAG: DMT family transporter [Anaerolineales bacterium]